MTAPSSVVSAHPDAILRPLRARTRTHRGYAVNDEVDGMAANESGASEPSDESSTSAPAPDGPNTEEGSVGGAPPDDGAEVEGSAAQDAPEVEVVEADAPAEPAELDPLVAARLETARIRDQLMRTAADFDNFRKRSRRDVADAERKGREDLLRELLPVFDNLERAAQHAETATDVRSLSDGIGMVMRQFVDTLERSGIARIAAVGAPFDPMVHEAIQQLESADLEPGTVAAEVQTGYRMGDRLIRPSMVVVAKRPAS